MQFLLTQEEYDAMASKSLIDEREQALNTAFQLLQASIPTSCHNKPEFSDSYRCGSCILSSTRSNGKAEISPSHSRLICTRRRYYSK